MTERDDPDTLARALLDASLDAIFGMDAAGNVIELNEVAESMFGRTRAELLGQPLVDVVMPPRLRSAHLRELERLRASGEPRVLGRRLELVGLRADGSEFPAEVRIVMARTADGEVFYGVIRDVTALARAEADRERVEQLAAHADDLTELTIRLEQAYRELESFSYAVSHDLRAPLRAVNGHSAILLEDYGAVLDEAGRKRLLRIGAASSEMSTIIDALLQLGRLGRVEPHARVLDLGAIVEVVAAELRGAHPDRLIELRVQAGMHAHADPELLRIALDNLLGNAWKYTSHRSDALVEVGMVEGAASPTWFVRDNGIGFDMKEASRLFVPFRRLSTAGDRPGTGVGLATVERIVRRHGGRVWGESEPGAGATFFFTLAPEPHYPSRTS